MRLEANAGRSFVGSYVLGMGFTFDDTDKKGIASPLAEMQHLLDVDPHNLKAIFPYIGGEEVNTSPTHAHHRYAIDFKDYPLRREDVGKTWRDSSPEQRREWLREAIVPLDYPGPVAKDWPDLLAIVEERAKPERDVQNRKAIRERWWQYADKRPGLYSTIANLDRVLAIAQVTQHVAFAFLPSDIVYAHRLYIFADSRNAMFAVLQSRVHEIWSRFFGSSLEERFMYAAANCFETFPFPDDWETNPNLDAGGEDYYVHRAALMVRNDEGMTKTYNRFHDPYEGAPAIGRLRELHAAMDRAVLDAYGWEDLATDCEFFLDFEIDEATWGSKKKPYRLRWPEKVHDEVLARLIALNAERAALEGLAEEELPFHKFGQDSEHPTVG